MSASTRRGVTRLTSPNPQARGPYLANRAFLGQVVAKFPVNSPTCVSRDISAICPVPDKLAVATWALSRSWHNFELRRAGERGSKTVPSPGLICGDQLRCRVTDTLFGTLPAH